MCIDAIYLFKKRLDTCLLHWAIFAFLVSFPVKGLTASGNVNICLGDGSEWAPFTYWERTNGAVNKDKLTGAATEVITEVLKKLNLTYSFTYMPWARVQAQMASYDGKQLCDMSWDASFKEARFEKYFYSPALYRTHLGVFYSTEKFKDSPPLRSVSDLSHFELCGIVGYNYDKFQLKKEITRVNTIDQVLKLVEGKRCDLFLSEIETLYGGNVVGAFSIPKAVSSMRIPGLYKTFYAIFSKKSPVVEKMIVPFNQHLIRLQAVGESEAIFKRYLPEGSGL